MSGTDPFGGQYEVYPYPERDPKDEKKRLITGSPSHPIEVDHCLFGGRRDWAAGTRILVAGGGTGDALVQLAQSLTSAGRPHEITYLDLSKAAREIAEARIAARGLSGVRFETGSLLEAATYGPFDYIDCCGVLHHLDDPQAGFDALAHALAPGGGLGLMVYAPLGRSGVYPLQEAFTALLEGLSPPEKLAAAKQVFEALPKGHPFLSNPHLVDHKASDAGFYDLLLHAQDRPFTIDRVLEMLQQAGLSFSAVPQPILYDLSRFVSTDRIPGNLATSMALAEQLDGTLKTHIVYASADPVPIPDGRAPDLVPVLKGVDPAVLARRVAKTGTVPVTLNGEQHQVTLPKEAAQILGAIDGRRDLRRLQALGGHDPVAWGAIWMPVHRALTAYGLLVYSRLRV